MDSPGQGRKERAGAKETSGEELELIPKGRRVGRSALRVQKVLDSRTEARSPQDRVGIVIPKKQGILTREI